MILSIKIKFTLCNFKNKTHTKYDKNFVTNSLKINCKIIKKTIKIYEIMFVKPYFFSVYIFLHIFL